MASHIRTTLQMLEEAPHARASQERLHHNLPGGRPWMLMGKPAPAQTDNASSYQATHGPGLSGHEWWWYKHDTINLHCRAETSKVATVKAAHPRR